MNILNKELYDALLPLTQSTLGIISRNFHNNQILISESRWVKRGRGAYIKAHINKPFWGAVFHKAYDEVNGTEEYKNFINVTKTNAIISSQIDELVGTPFGSSRLEAINILYWSVSEFLSEEGIDDFNISNFDIGYTAIEGALFSDKVKYENLTPLCGFRMDGTKLILSDNISIEKLTEKEILEFFKLGIKLGHSIGGSDLVHSVHEYAIKTSYEVAKVIGGTSIEDVKDDEIFSDFNEQDIINSLRIYKAGKLYPITTIRRARSLLSSGTSFMFEKPVKHFMHNQYNLSNTEMDDFKLFWATKNESKLHNKKFLDVAIRRFSQSNERDNLEDEIIDLMISAEALFLSSGENSSGELKYRLAHRAAMFLETDIKQQMHVFEFMQSAYKVRSAIVHGNEPKLPKKIDGSEYEGLKEFSGVLEEYLRISLKKMITSDDGSKKICWKSIIFPSDRCS